MNKKYEFTGETKEHEGRTLHRIRRIKDGLVGGWIESEFNLSHKDNCFIYDNAMVYENAIVCDDAEVCGYAEIYGDARVCGYAKVYDNAEIYNYARVYNNAEVCGYAEVFDVAKIYEGRIIGEVSLPYKDIFQHQCKNRMLTVILTESDEILYTIGCQDNITKEVFLSRIYNGGGGLEENPHRKEYLRLIPLIEQYFKN